METWAVIITAIGSAIVGAIPGIIAWKKSAREEKQADNDYLFGQYRKLSEELRNEVSRLQSQFVQLQKEHLDCKRENAELRGRVAALEEAANA